MKRRTFIKRSSTAAVPVMLGKVNVSAINNPFFNLLDNGDDRVLVLIQMSGGNDGLNMLLPKDQYGNLHAVRSNILLPENKILDLTDTVGINPAMSSLREVYDQGKLNIIQSVGYPGANRSHFRSTDIWQSASSSSDLLTTGWLGRYFNLLHPDYPTGYPNEDYPDPFAITIGSSVNETCEGTGGNFSTALVDPTNLTALATPINRTLPDSCFGDKMEFLVNSIIQTNAYNDVIEIANEKGANISSKYEDNSTLANKLKVVARLIAGGLKTKVYVVDIGGWDTHGDQVTASDYREGRHPLLLNELSEAITAFQDDLKQLGIEEKVLGMTYSEFGRQIKSNASQGTDHGTAAPLMVFGTCVNSAILGDNPEISPTTKSGEGVPMQFDFRSVYGSILVDWFGVEEQSVRDLLFMDFQHLPILNNCSVTTALDFLDKQQIGLTAFPNPFTNQTKLDFTLKTGWARISIFDTIGHEIKVLSNQRFKEGTHSIIFNSNRLPTGTYFCHVKTNYGQEVKRLVKVQ